jgi:hypothetical protein
MARNKIEANKAVFSALRDFVAASGHAVPHPHIARYIRTDETERNWLINAKVLGDPLPILPRFRTALVEHLGIRYLIIVGWDQANEPTEVAAVTEMNAGLATMLLAELRVPVRQFADPLRVINEIFIEGDERNMAAFDAGLVREFFDPVTVYAISETSPFEGKNLARLACFFVSKNKDRLSLSFSDETMSVVQQISLLGVASIPFENILHAMNAVRWEHAFLEAYRCVEQMFPVPVISELRKKLSLTTPIFDLSAHLESVTGWRAKEEDALKQICSGTPKTAKDVLLSIDDDPELSADTNLGSWIYKRRNAIVHFRPGNQAVRMKDESWDKLIRGVLLITEHYYSEHDHILSSPPSPTA